ncbi:uncharacterized protein LOC117168267 isoform X3 [Belonocnema kinseyi]|uniref:uncharacterized protein LOC117168267 isoform X3 n=1 Tax=Belonocnema kinseyi TaxID=2817044 RepID=UPI00143DD49C|nr:uncharacterized protein LOC117168267 isoform X3 [Belonocnema kinseyi]
MLVRIVNWFFFGLCVTVSTLQGENAPVDETDYWGLRTFSDEQIPFLQNYRNKRDVSVKKLSRFDSLADQDSGVQELSEFFVGNIKCTRSCVERKTTKMSEEGTYRLLNLVWTFSNGENKTASVSTPIVDNIPTPQHVKKKEQSSTNSALTEKRCELYLVVDCDIPKTRESSLNKEEKKFIEDLYPSFKSLANTAGKSDKSNDILVQKHDSENTETKFHVKNSVERLSIIILGNISKIDLEIPTADQETPLGWNKTMDTPDLMLSLTRMSETMGVRLNARNPPSGGWCLKLTPVEGSNYRFMIATKINDSKREDKTGFDGDESSKELRKDELVQQRKVNQKVVDNPSISDRIDDNSENMENQALNWKTLNANKKQSSQDIFMPSKERDTRELSEATNLNSRIAMSEIDYLNAESNPNNFMKIMNTPQIEERKFSEAFELEDLTKDSTDNFLRKKSVTIDVNPDSELIIRPGTGRVRIAFDVRNNQMLTTKICYTARGSPLGPVELYPSVPRDGYCNVVGPGQTSQVAVELVVPNGISDTVNTVILTAQVFGFSGFDIVEKSAYLYIQNTNSRKTDDKSPTIRYYFNNNCNGRLKEDRCSKSIWSVDITVQDVDAGLKVVSTSPSGITAQADYVTGTTNPVTFFYYATCCHQTVDISAVDMYGNYNNQRIDVTGISFSEPHSCLCTKYLRFSCWKEQPPV